MFGKYCEAGKCVGPIIENGCMKDLDCKGGLCRKFKNETFGVCSYCSDSCQGKCIDNDYCTIKSQCGIDSHCSSLEKCNNETCITDDCDSCTRGNHYFIYIIL